MTIEGPQAEQTSSTEPTSSIASTDAQLWDEVLQQLAKVQAVAPSSAQLWDEVLQRLTEVRETHTKLATAVDHLGALLSSALATERQRDLARRGIVTDFALDVDVPPLLVVPASPDVEPSEPSDEMPLLPEQTVTDALRAPEEPETYEPEAHETSYEGEHPWLAESVMVTPVNGYEIEEEGPWLAEPGVTEAVEESSEAPAETAQASPETAVLEIPEDVAFQTPEVVDALFAAEFGDAAVMVMDPKTITLDAFLAEEFAPADRGNEAATEDLLPPTPTDPPSWSLDTPFLAGESTLPVEPPPIPAPIATADTADLEDTLTDVDATDEATEPEADTDPPSWSLDTPFLVGEPTLPVEPPPIPAPIATADTADLEDTLTDVDTADEAAPENLLPPTPTDPPSWSFASMTTEILEAAPEEPQRGADTLPADEVTRESQDPLGPNVVSQDFTIISKRRKHSHLHLR
jgi:hypothetical protein